MARMMDDASRARLLSSLLDQNIGQPLTRGQAITDEDVEDEDPPEGRPAAPVDPRGAPAPMPGNEMSSKEPIVPVPASLANAGMQALMMQASAGRSMGADGALPGLMGPLDTDDDVPTNRGPDVPADAYDRTPSKRQIDKSDSMSDAPAGRRRRG